ncbi:MAG TPA: nucleoside triphosphate pyrophosphohydrolase [Magnetospirillaceae bacterium]|jgi:ATP diphosphatase
MPDDRSPQRPIDRLLAIMARLRAPDGGCPWDLEQTYATIAPHTIEEAYEVAEAIELDDRAGLKDELGDLLFQVVFYAQMGREDGSFDFDAIATAISDKMERRHPHVFGAGATVDSANAQVTAWETQKAGERAAKAKSEAPPSALDGVGVGLPALTRAQKLGARAARVGFDWPEAKQVLDKIEEEIEEVKVEIASGAEKDRLDEEVGDLLFAVVNLARKLGLDAEGALRRGSRKFERRFHAVEAGLAAQGLKPAEAGLEKMEALWVAAKEAE